MKKPFDTRGETLLEGIVSILIMTVLIAAVTMMITTSLRMTGNSFGSATARQDQANVVMGLIVPGVVPATVDTNISFTVEISVDGVTQPSLSLPFPITTVNGGGFSSFGPRQP
jgi:Tfp pilus assembly protein PilV